MDDLYQNQGFMGRLVAGEGGYRTLRFLTVVLLLAGTVWSGFLFKKYVDLTADSPIVIPPGPDLAAKDQERLDSLAARFGDAASARIQSFSVASSIVNGNREPFTRTYPPSAVVGVTAGVEGTKEEHVFVPFVPEKLPPIMFVRAIMVAGNQAVAVMDIEGVGTGIIVRKGFSFAGGEGRVLSIGTDKVTIQWSGKRKDITPGL